MCIRDSCSTARGARRGARYRDSRGDCTSQSVPTPIPAASAVALPVASRAHARSRVRSQWAWAISLRLVYPQGCRDATTKSRPATFVTCALAQLGACDEKRKAVTCRSQSRTPGLATPSPTEGLGLPSRPRALMTSSPRTKLEGNTDEPVSYTHLTLPTIY